MKPVVLLAMAFSVAASDPNCNEQERNFLKNVAKKQFGYGLIYAVDQSLSSVNSVDTMFQYLSYSHRDQKFPFIIDLTKFVEPRFGLVNAPGFCNSSNYFERSFAPVGKNKTMLGVFYGCNMLNFAENIYIVISPDHPSYSSFKEIRIDRAMQSKFCKCREIQRAFTRNCLTVPDNTESGLMVVFFSAAVFLALLAGARTLLRNRVKSNAVLPYID